MDPWNGQQLIGVDGSPLQIRGCVQITLKIAEKNLKVPLQNKRTTNQISAQLVQTVHIPPRCEKEVLAHSQIPCSSNQQWLLEHKPSKLNSVVIARAIVSPINGTFPVRLVNLSDLRVTLYKNTKIGMLEDIDRIGIATVSADTVKKEIPKKLTEKQYQVLKDLVV